MVASWIFEKNEDLFEKASLFKGIYRDDGLIVFKDNLGEEDVNRWLETFQMRVDDLCRSKDIQFTCEIWKDSESEKSTETNVSENI